MKGRVKGNNLKGEHAMGENAVIKSKHGESLKVKENGDFTQLRESMAALT